MCRQNQRALTVTYALSFCFVIASDFVPFSTILLPSSRLSVFGRHKALLLCKSPCEGGCVGGRKTPLTPSQAPSEEKFPEEICSSPEQDRKSAARHRDCAKHFKPELRQRKNESAQILLGTPDFYCITNIELQRSLRGRGPSVWESVQRKPFRRVFFGVFFLLQSVFFLARARKKMR